MVLPVRELVREHPLELLRGDELEDPLGDADDRVLGIPPGRERVRLRVRRDRDDRSPARWRRRSTIAYSSGACAWSTTRAPYMRSTIDDDAKYMKKFIAPAKSSMMVIPPCPPKDPPSATRRAVSPAISMNTFMLFIAASLQS